MTAEDIIYDIFEIKNALEDDHDLEEFWLLKKIGAYRQAFIIQDFQLNGQIKSSWLQRIYKTKTVKVTSADDPVISYTSISLSRAVVPEVMSLPDDMGLFRVTGSSGILPYDHIGMDALMMKIHFGEERMGSFGYCCRMGTNLYLWPLVMEVQAYIVAADPMSVPFMDTVTGVTRPLEITDEYPVDAYTAQQIVLEICSKDLQLNMKSIADIVNDSKHQLRVVQSEVGQAQ